MKYFVILEIDDEDLLALREALPIMTLSAEFRERIAEALNDAENDNQSGL